MTTKQVSTFGEKLRAARMMRGMSLRDLGSAVGLSHVYIGEVERGKKHPMEAHVSVVAAALGMKASVMRSWVDSEKCDSCGHWKAT